MVTTMRLKLPLETKVCEGLLEHFASIPAINAFDQLPPELPNIEELTPLWMILMSHQRALAVANPGDHYYETTTLFSNLARG